jgi:hypothetical protein
MVSEVKEGDGQALSNDGVAAEYAPARAQWPTGLFASATVRPRFSWSTFGGPVEGAQRLPGFDVDERKGISR